jgi:outer membrane protein assembly factor BamB
MRYKILIGFLCCILVVSVFGGIVAASDWSQMHYDASHTGYTTDAGPITNNVLWSYNTSLAVTSSVAESGGYVYVPSGANLLCLNVQTGALVWNYTSPDFGKVWGAAIANGYVYTGTDGYHIYCLNATTGTQVWNYTTAGTDYTTTVSGSYVYAGSGHYVYCLNASTGALVWNYTTGGGAYVPSVSGNYVYVGSDDGKVYCLNAQTGASVWNYTTGDSIYSTPAVSGGYVYVGSIDHNVYCLNAQTGEKVWNYTADSFVFSGPAVANGYVYVGSYSGNFYCLNAQNGNLVWNYTTGIGSQDHAILCSAAVSGNGYVYFGSDDYSIYCLNAQNGNLVWNYTTLGYVTSGPSVVDGFLFIGSNDGRVFAFGTLQNAALSIQDSAPSVTVGNSLTVSGSLSPTSSGTATIWESINGSAFTMLNETTLTNGGYSYKFNPSAVGSYQFYASWPGNFPYNPANSSTISVSVTAVPLTTPTLSLQTSASSIPPGQTVTLSGSLSPSASGTVALSESVNGSAFQQIVAAVTLTNGGYSYSYAISGAGTYKFYTSFAGNSQLNPAQSSTVTVTSTPATPSSGTDYTMYIIIIVVAVIIIAVLYYLLAMRPKNKPAK